MICDILMLHIRANKKHTPELRQIRHFIRSCDIHYFDARYVRDFPEDDCGDVEAVPEVHVNCQLYKEKIGAHTFLSIRYKYQYASKISA